MSGASLAAYFYEPFGDAPADAGANNAGSFYGYNGERYDPLSSLQFLRARYYDPGMGRFTAADTYPGKFIDPLSINKYSYVQNDPINHIDPSGHFLQKIGNALKTVGTAIANTAKNVATTVVNAAKVVGSAVVTGVTYLASVAYDYIVKPTASFYVEKVVSPTLSFMTQNSSPETKARVNQITTAMYDSLDKTSQTLYNAYKQAEQATIAHAQTLHAQVTKQFCTTAARIGSAGTPLPNNTNSPILSAPLNGPLEVGITEYASTYEGSTVTYDMYGGCVVSWNGMSFYAKPDFKDGRCVVDDSAFVNAFGIGNKKLVVFQDSVNNNVSIRANFNINGNAADSTLGGDKYRDLFLRGVQEHWSRSFSSYDVSTNVGEDAKGIKVNISAVNINEQYEREYGQRIPDYSLMKPSHSEWSPTNTGRIYMRTGDTRNSNLVYLDSQFMWISAHEFGHILGVGDAYPNNPGLATIMNEPPFIYDVQRDDITKVLQAQSTGTWQTWP